MILPWINSLDLLRREQHVWIIDFGTHMSRDRAALYQQPYWVVKERVRPKRMKVKRKRYSSLWWLHAEPCPGMRMGITKLTRFLATPTLAKHRLFAWSARPTLPDHQLVVFARSDDYFFGVLHSRLHEVWALRLGTRLETRPRYTPTTCFETFPFPWAPGAEPTESPVVQTIAQAARKLNALRENWLNPPEWTKTETLEFPGTIGGPWDRYIDRDTVHDLTTPDDEQIQIGSVRYPRTVARDEQCAKRLKKRTLTNLYNERPAWLDHAHRELDDAVCAAYTATTGENWPSDMDEEEILSRLLALNLARAGAES